MSRREQGGWPEPHRQRRPRQPPRPRQRPGEDDLHRRHAAARLFLPPVPGDLFVIAACTWSPRWPWPAFPSGRVRQGHDRPAGLPAASAWCRCSSACRWAARGCVRLRPRRRRAASWRCAWRCARPPASAASSSWRSPPRCRRSCWRCGAWACRRWSSRSRRWSTAPSGRSSRRSPPRAAPRRRGWATARSAARTARWAC